jgi:hypothetical protein
MPRLFPTLFPPKWSVATNTFVDSREQLVSLLAVAHGLLDLSRLEKTVRKPLGVNRLDKQPDALPVSPYPLQSGCIGAHKHSKRRLCFILQTEKRLFFIAMRIIDPNFLTNRPAIQASLRSALFLPAIIVLT